MRGAAALRWEVLAARMTLFHDGKSTGKSWWHLLHGSKAPSHAKRGPIVEESGQIDGHKLTLLEQPGRLDLLIGGDVPASFPAKPIISRVTFEVVAGKILPLLSKLTAIAELPSADRVAFGIALCQAHPTRAEALGTLAEIFPGVSRELEQSADFVFQINHPRTDSIGDHSLRVNYLQKWFFGSLKLADRRPKGAPADLPLEAFTANVEIDMSTARVPGRKWSANEAALIFQHLLKAAKRLLEESRS